MAAPLDGLAPSALFDLAGYRHASLFADIEFAWDALARIAAYLDARAEVAIEGTVHPGAWLEGDGISIGEGSVVEPGAYIQGPVAIGRDTEVRHGAYIRGNVVVGDRCVIGHTTEVKGSIFLDGAKAGHFAYIGDSILGNDVNLGAGTKLANLRLDGKSVTLNMGQKERVDTGRRKLGAILGDRVETGCNSVTNPGTVLGRGAVLWPCTSGYGYRGPGEIVRSS